MPARESTAPKPEKNKSLEQWIWVAACYIRSAKDAQKYTCGSGGLLINCKIAMEAKNKGKNLAARLSAFPKSAA